MSLQRRQDRIERLLARAPAQWSPNNNANSIIDLNIREVLKIDPFVRRLWECRREIIVGAPKVKVPPKYLDFFIEYAGQINAPAHGGITADNSFPYDGPPWDGQIIRPMAAMYSGGSESVMMDMTFTWIELLRVRNFFPSSRMSREFQLALVGLTLGYGVLSVGVGFRAEMTNRRNYEMTRDFVDSWNESSYPYTMQYPIAWYSKADTYKFLMLNRIDFVACETTNTDGSECGKCWDCAEKYFFQSAVKASNPRLADFEVKPLDYGWLKRVQRLNRENLRMGPKDPWANTTDGLLNLEREYGYTLWRTGEPPPPAPALNETESQAEVPDRSPHDANSGSSPEQGA